MYGIVHGAAYLFKGEATAPICYALEVEPDQT